MGRHDALGACLAAAAVVSGELARGPAAFSLAVVRAQQCSVSVSSSSRDAAARADGKGLLLGRGLIVTSIDVVALRAPTGEVWPVDDIEVAGPGAGPAASATLLVLIDGAGLALLHADAFAAVPPARLGDSSKLIAGAQVFSAVEVRGRSPLSSGVVVAETVRELSNATLHYVQTTLLADPGFAGAPVFDDRGEVVGIAVGEAREGVVFLRIEDVRELLRPLARPR
jgi:S1-C subfamily serine protease